MQAQGADGSANSGIAATGDSEEDGAIDANQVSDADHAQTVDGVKSSLQPTHFAPSDYSFAWMNSMLPNLCTGFWTPGTYDGEHSRKWFEQRFIKFDTAILHGRCTYGILDDLCFATEVQMWKSKDGSPGAPSNDHVESVRVHLECRVPYGAYTFSCEKDFTWKMKKWGLTGPYIEEETRLIDVEMNANKNHITVGEKVYRNGGIQQRGTPLATFVKYVTPVHA